MSAGRRNEKSDDSSLRIRSPFLRLGANRNASTTMTRLLTSSTTLCDTNGPPIISFSIDHRPRTSCI